VGEREKSLTSLTSPTRQRPPTVVTGEHRYNFDPGRPCRCKVVRSHGLALDDPPSPAALAYVGATVRTVLATPVLASHPRNPHTFEPAPSPHGLALDDPPQRCSRTFAHVRATVIPFQILVRDDPSETLRGRVTISQRLVLFIQMIKPKRQLTVTHSQPSPSADSSLYDIKSIGIYEQRRIAKNTGG
jgi:hypothetical protein